MHQVSVHEAKKRLGRLLDEVLAGSEVILVRGNVPVAKLVAMQRQKKRRVGGLDRGKIKISDDFNAPLKDFEDAFYH